MERKKHINRISFIISLVLMCLVLGSSLNARANGAETVKLHTLDDYIKFALINNPGLKAAYEKWQAALEKVNSAKTLPDPKLTYSNYIEEVETRVGAQQYSVGISQTFPWFGKLDLRSKAAFEAANSEKASYDERKLLLISKIKKLYYEYSYLAQAIRITQDNITLLSNFESVARTRYKGGVGLQSAVIKIQVELGKLEDRLASLKDSTRPVAAKLNSTMNRPSSDGHPLPEKIPNQKISLSRSELIPILKEENPTLKALDFMAERNNYLIGLAEKNNYPDVTFGLKYIDTESRSDASPSDNGKDPIVASVSLNIPLWKKKYESLEKGIRAEYQSVLHSRSQVENSLIADLEMAFYNLRDAERKITLYKDTLLPKAKQNLSINRLAFSSDKASFLDLIDAQRVLLEFQLAEKRALTDYGIALAEIEMLTGYNLKGI